MTAVLGCDHIERLGAILGERGLLTDAGGLTAYETGARYDRGRAAFVARPSTVDMASQVVAYCARHEIALIPQAANTGLVAGSTPDGGGLQGVLSVERLRTTFDLDLDNRTLRVDAGFRLSEINARLEPHGLFFPIDLGADPMAGGMAASNTGGARFLRFGDVRRNTLGLTAILGDESGSVVEFGKGLRKDNTGPDWKQLFIGTAGGFGIIAQCVFNLERLPRQVATAYLVLRSPDRVPALLVSMEERLGSYLSAFEGMSGAAIRHALDHSETLRNPFPRGEIPDYVILAELSRSWPQRDGEQSLEAVFESVLAEVWEHPDTPLLDAFVGPPQEMWGLRHALSEGVKAAGHVIGIDLCFRRGEAMRFRSAMQCLLDREFPEVELCDFGHIGDGGVHFNLLVPRDTDGHVETTLVERLRERVITAAVEAHGASFSAEHGLGRRNQHLYDRYTPAKLKTMAAQLRRVTSPAPLGATNFC